MNLLTDRMIIDCEFETATIEATSSEPGITYSWVGPNSFSSNPAEIQVLDGGEYTVLIEFSDGCSLSQSITIESYFDQPIAEIDFDGELNCEVQSVILDGSMTTASSNAIFQWFDTDNNVISTEIMIEVFTEGSYILIVTDNLSKCTSTDEVLVSSSYLAPTAKAFTTEILNCENESVELNGALSTLTNNTTIQWTDENGNIISTILVTEVSVPGFYYLLLTDTESMCSSDEVEVQVIEYLNNPTVEILANPGNIFDCIIETIELTTIPEANTLYSWVINNEEISNDIEIEVSNSSDVTLIALDTVSFCSKQTILEFDDYTQYPLIEIMDFEAINCNFEETCIVINTLTFGQETTIIWTDQNQNVVSENTTTYCTNTPGMYTIEIIDNENACSNNLSFSVDEPIIPIGSLPSENELLIDENYQLIPTLNITASQLKSITWISDADLSCYDCLQPFVSNFENGDIITLIIESISGYTLEISTRIKVKIIKIPSIYIQNVFTPRNGQDFTIFASEEVTLIQNMYIYDRWGELIFTNENFLPNDPDLGWNGSFNEQKAEQGVYIYLFVYELDCRLVRDYGDVTLFW